MDNASRPIGRRTFLRAGVATAATLVLAGCTGDGDGDGGGDAEGTEPTITPEQQLPTPVAGDPDAAVTVAAFEDFACGHCQTYSLETLPPIWTDYVESGRIRYEWHDFPLPVDQRHSWLAADAARAVQAEADAATFFEYADLLFENQGSLSLSTYETLANDVGVDGATVREETEARTYEPTVTQSKTAGDERGVERTPTVFVDGEKLVGPSTTDLRDAIDAALAGD